MYAWVTDYVGFEKKNTWWSSWLPSQVSECLSIFCLSFFSVFAITLPVAIFPLIWYSIHLSHTHVYGWKHTPIHSSANILQQTWIVFRVKIHSLVCTLYTKEGTVTILWVYIMKKSKHASFSYKLNIGLHDIFIGFLT